MSALEMSGAAIVCVAVVGITAVKAWRSRGMDSGKGEGDDDDKIHRQLPSDKKIGDANAVVGIDKEHAASSSGKDDLVGQLNDFVYDDDLAYLIAIETGSIQNERMPSML